MTVVIDPKGETTGDVELRRALLDLIIAWKKHTVWDDDVDRAIDEALGVLVRQGGYGAAEAALLMNNAACTCPSLPEPPNDDCPLHGDDTDMEIQS
jgi:hypothetical protein